MHFFRTSTWVILLLLASIGGMQGQSVTIKELMAKAEAGDPIAQNSLGSSYQTGKGVTKDQAQAFKWFLKAAEQGLPLAQYNLGFMLYRGSGTQQDFQEALRWIGKSASQGFAVAQTALAGFYYRGAGGLPKNYDAAFFWYQKAASQGYPTAQYLLGLMFLQGLGVEQDYVRATAWFELASRGGDKGASAARDKATQFLDAEQTFEALQMASSFKPIAQEDATGPEPTLGLDQFPTSDGVLYSSAKNSSTPKAGEAKPAQANSLMVATQATTPAQAEPEKEDPEKPGFLNSLKKIFSAPATNATTTASPPATNSLPQMKPLGKPKAALPPSPGSTASMDSLLSKAKAGDIEAQTELGHLYARGAQGAKQDFAKAVEWFTRAADKGSSPAQRALGLMFLHGRGVTQDLTYAVQRLGQAALSGDPRSQHWLGVVYEKADDAESARWYKMAAEQGHAPSQLALGRLTAEGRGVPQDYVEAAKWLELAAAGGGAEALSLLQTLHEFMSLTETNEARTRASSFKASAK